MSTSADSGRGTGAPGQTKQSADFLRRGIKKPSPLGSTVFVGLRGLDPLLQYGILAKGVGSALLSKIGLSQLPAGLATNTGTFVDSLGLSPYRLILLSMATGSAMKQIYWLLGTSNEEFTPQIAVAVSLFNSVLNAVNTLLFTTTLASASLSSSEIYPQWPLIIGSAAYVVGLGIETTSEIQRQNFKADPKNEGKPFTGGLWQYARHVNYLGYSIWRAGFTTAAAGFTAGFVVLGLLLADFDRRAIPSLDEYCSGRYGVQWQEFKRKTPFKLIPGVY